MQCNMSAVCYVQVAFDYHVQVIRYDAITHILEKLTGSQLAHLGYAV